MSTRTTIAIGVGAGILAVGAAVGVGALAANLAGGGDTQQQAGYGQGGPGGDRDGTRQGRGGMDTTQLASDLASRLGVDQAKVETALKEVMAASRASGPASGQPSGAPTGQPSGNPAGNQNGRGGQFLQTLAQALADKLGLDEAKVLAALQEVWQDQGGPGGGWASGQPTQK